MIISIVSGSDSHEPFLQYALKTLKVYPLLTGLYESVVAHCLKSVQWALE